MSGRPGAKPPKDYAAGAAFPDAISLRPIAVVRSPYLERHGTPRQASVLDPRESAASAATIELLPWVPTPSLQSLAGFERIWVISWMHLNEGWKPTLRPPRDPANNHGVLATRAPHRPNSLALSAVQLTAVRGRVLHVQGIDLLDGTPVLDIKPYVPYADAFPDAAAGWTQDLSDR